MDYRSGLDRLISTSKIIKLKNKNIGLITNQSGLTRDYRRNIDIFNNSKIFNLKAIFAPEHGYTGAARDRAFVESTIDQGSGLPIYSLYGDSRKPERDILSRIELLIFDIQDIGLRYYTFISTLFLVMESCADFDMPLLILDRMNPLGRKVEGWLLEEDFSSFEGLYPLVHRHGMTVGELALWAKKEKELNFNLEIIKRIVDKPDLVESNLVGLTIINKIRELYPEYFTWIKHKGDNRYFFDLLMGTDLIRKELEAGCSPEEIIKKRKSAVADFNIRRQQFLLY